MSFCHQCYYIATLSNNLSQKTLNIQGTEVTATLKRSRRAKHIRLTLNSTGLIITRPWYVPEAAALAFAKHHESWILQKLPQLEVPKASLSPHQITTLRLQARDLVRSRLEHFNKYYHFSFHRITIRDQKSRWGSCSANKTLSFNFRIALLPSDLADYLVVHELCHLKEMNHSASFWALVAQTIPNYRQLRRRLRSQPL